MVVAKRKLPVKRFGYEVPLGMKGHKEKSRAGEPTRPGIKFEAAVATFVGCRLYRNRSSRWP